MHIEVFKAMTTVVNSIKTDKDTRGSLKSLFARAIYDECKERGSEMDHVKLNELCIAAADRCLTELCK